MAKTRSESIDDLRNNKLTSIQNKYTQLDRNDPNSAYSKGISLRNDYNNKVAAVAAAMANANGEYANYGDGKKFAKGEITDGRTAPLQDEGCCTKTKALIEAEDALKKCYVEVDRVLHYPAYHAKRLGFLSIDPGALRTHFASIISKINTIIGYLEDENIEVETINREIHALNGMLDLITASKKGTLIAGIIQSSENLGETVENDYNTLIDNVNSTYKNHVPCHKNPENIILTIYPDVTKYTGSTTATGGQEVQIEKGVKISDQTNRRLINRILNSVTDDDKIYNFKHWNGYAASDVQDAVFTEDTSIYGVWEIYPDVRWYIDDVEKVHSRIPAYEFFTDVKEMLNAQRDAFNYKWNSSTDYDDEEFTEQIISPTNREWKIKRKTKELTVKIFERTKTASGWSEYVEKTNWEKKVKYLEDYPTSDLPINYENALKQGEYINTPQTKKYVLAEESPSYKKITEDITLKIDVIDLYSVIYRNEYGAAAKTHLVEVGTMFDIDASENKPKGWPTRKYTNNTNGLVYEIEDSPNDYSPRGSQTINNNIIVDPHYKQLDTVMLTFYPDVTKYTAKTTADGGQNVEVEKGKKLSEQANYKTTIKSILDSKTNNDIYKFVSWTTESSIENIYPSENLSVYGVWNIVPEITWDVETTKVTGLGKNLQWEFFSDVTEGLNVQWDACEERWGDTTDAVTQRYTNEVITPSKRSWTIERKKKNFNVYIVRRDKLVDGWGDYSKVTQTEQSVKSGNDYNIADLPTAYMNVLKDDEYISRGPARSYKYKLVNGSPSYKNIVADTVISVDVIPLYSVNYLDENDKLVKSYADKEMGSTFDIDSYWNKPSNWPPKQKITKDNQGKDIIHELNESPNDYSPRGVQTITDDIEVKPSYVEPGHYAQCGVFIYQRDKGLDGTYGEYELTSGGTVDYGKDYKFSAGEIQFYKALKDGSYTVDNVEKIVKSENCPDLTKSKSITADVSFYFDRIPLYKVEYMNEKGNVEKTHIQEIGWQFDVDNDANKPANWPKDHYFDNDGLVHRIDENNQYSPSGLITIDKNYQIVPKYLDPQQEKLSCECKCALGDYSWIKQQIDDGSWEIESNAASVSIDGVSLNKEFTVPLTEIVPDSSKTFMKSSFENFKNQIKSIYTSTHEDRFNATWETATKNGKVKTEVFDFLPEKAIAECNAFGFNERYFYEFDTYGSTGGDDEVRKKIVYCLPYSYTNKIKTNLLGWPEDTFKEIVKTYNNKKYVCIQVDGENWKKDGDVEHYAWFKALPYVHFVYGENAVLPSVDIDPEATQQFNPLTDGDFTNKAPTPYQQEGYYGKWREANNQGQLIVQTKTLDNQTFFDDLTFHYDYEPQHRLHFIYGTGSTRSNEEIREPAVIDDPNNPSHIDYPSPVPDTAAEGYIDDGDDSWDVNDITRFPTPITSDVSAFYNYITIEEAISKAENYTESILQRGTVKLWAEENEPWSGDSYQKNVVSGEYWISYVYKDQLIKSGNHEITSDTTITLPGKSPMEITDEDTGKTITINWHWKRTDTGTLYEPGTTVSIPVNQGDPPSETNYLEKVNGVWQVVTRNEGNVSETNFIVDIDE